MTSRKNIKPSAAQRLVMHPLTDAAMREALDEFELVCENNDVRKLTDAEKYAAQEFALSLVHGDPSGAPVAEAEPTDKLAPALILTGAQLLEAIDFIAPDRSADQLESEVSFQRGNGHDGEGMYCWATEYPDEGAMKIDGTTVAAQAVAADGAAPTGTPFENCQFRNCDLPGQCKAEGKCHHPRAAVSPATAESCAGMPDEVRDSLMDSQYLAGVKAGWNAANAADPNAALEKIHASRAGYLRPLRDWQKAGRPGVPATPATADTTWKAPKRHCQNGGDVCLAGNRDGVCCPEDSCDIDDGTRKNPAALPIKIPHVHIRPEDEEIGRQYYALGFVDGSRSITDAPATADELAAKLDDADIDTIAESMPGGLDSFMKQWGWRQFARAVEDEVVLNVARASQAAAPAEAREPLVLWQDGTGMLWDTYSHGKWMHRFVSPHGWDAHAVAQHLYGKGYAGHLEVRAVWSGNYAAPADAGEAVAPGGSLVPTERGIYAWVAEGSSALVLVHTRPTAHSPGGVMNASLLRSCEFYNGCPVDQWSGGTWYGPFKHVDAQGAQGGKGGEA
ncbi:hypothetical protein [Burkholderia gladioli]|uniref:hypothetical protein n=1 Tax=Burkholderia gladioli TaxID=28095 RepID=UPI00163F7B9D|nr:hypothetical protein [Burkholderia gladioli]